MSHTSLLFLVTISPTSLSQQPLTLNVLGLLKIEKSNLDTGGGWKFGNIKSN